MPQVDVVIPAYNAADFVALAIDSALAQEGVKVNVIVIDAGSTDDTAAKAAVADHRVTVHRSPKRLNAAQARNIGVRLGQAPWLAFLDADDLWPARRTLALIEAAKASRADIAFGHSLTFEDGTGIDTSADYALPNSATGPTPGTALMRRKTAEALGPMDETLAASEFVDWMARARRMGLVEVTVPIVALLRRSHASNSSRDPEENAADYLRTVARHLRQQR